MDKDVHYYTQKNLASWEQAADVHAKARPELARKVAQPAFDNLTPSFIELLASHPVEGRSIVQLCCNNGLDLISLKKRGAGYCLGIDGSAAFIAQGSALADSAQLSHIDFEQHNAYQLPQALRQQFDYVVVTVGVINWMPDLNAFFAASASLLKPGGVLLMQEVHPILNMYQQAETSFIDASYFQSTPYCDDQGLDYFNHTCYPAFENYWFAHRLSDIFNAAIAASLRLTSFEELAENIGNYCEDLAYSECNPPLAFTASWQC